MARISDALSQRVRRRECMLVIRKLCWISKALAGEEVDTLYYFYDPRAGIRRASSFGALVTVYSTQCDESN